MNQQLYLVAENCWGASSETGPNGGLLTVFKAAGLFIAVRCFFRDKYFIQRGHKP